MDFGSSWSCRENDESHSDVVQAFEAGLGPGESEHSCHFSRSPFSSASVSLPEAGCLDWFGRQWFQQAATKPLTQVANSHVSRLILVLQSPGTEKPKGL